MKYLLTMTIAFVMLGCNAQQGDSKFPDVSNEQAKELMAAVPNLQIIDVRTDGEVSNGMIKGAIQIDISKSDFDEKIGKLSKEAPVLVYCAAGGRSKTAQDKMKEMGFKEVHNLSGGYSGWK
ncbi:MAG: rhodanese-like domain-containing protein [Flavobacteriales bacterium]|nr:rhodanese-like domain-containing protein [Flavobacteriales bacterium]MBT3963171.1 rhodanese-like domain-containing protein [Flavobacteriales bacterium]MBT4930925.1 rhodanese-like domain-containing protein [Flavobacteriales bacterium]MBT5132737.1 rhodanese-like domain-containing protein [Flavobacteriales bacterium]MBT6132684.1 rhodanese-like domain-containing protein [Flavobacteriales bacterium]